MRAWLYYRLSRDEDKELNSLTNQKNILVEYAENNGYTVVGESFDDNVSGMHFNREGIEKIFLDGARSFGIFAERPGSFLRRFHNRLLFHVSTR